MRPYRRQIAAVVGLVCATALTMGPTAFAQADTLKAEADIATKDIGAKQNILGDFVADAIKAISKSDAAFVAADYFNEITIPKGTTSSPDVLKGLVMPGDTITIVKLTGDQIQRAMERSLFLYPKFNSGFLQVSGLVVTFRPDADVDRRIISIKIGGDTLDAGKTYHVAMPTPLAKGGLAYFKVWRQNDILKETDKTLQMAVTSYVVDHKILAKGEDRLVAKGK